MSEDSIELKENKLSSSLISEPDQESESEAESDQEPESNNILLRKDIYKQPRPRPFTPESLAQWLLGDIKAAEQAKRQKPNLAHIFSKTSSGQRLKWQAFKANPNCYFTKLSNASTTAKEKILFATALLKDRPPSFGELALMSALINYKHYYEVYLWEGEHKDYSKITPLTSATQFWSQRDKIKPAIAAKMAACFKEQHIPTTEWRFMGHSDYMEGWGYPRQKLDLTEVSLFTDEERKAVLQSVDISKIHEVTLFAPRPETLQFILRFFPNLSLLRLAGITGPWLEKQIHLLDKSGIKNLTLTDPILADGALKIDLPSAYGVERLFIAVERKKLYSIHLSLPEQEKLNLCFSDPEVRIFNSKNVSTEVDEEDNFIYPLNVLKDEQKPLGMIKLPSPVRIFKLSEFEELIGRGKSVTKNITSLSLCLMGKLVETAFYALFATMDQYFPHLKWLNIDIVDANIIQNDTATDSNEFVLSNLSSLEYFEFNAGEHKLRPNFKLGILPNLTILEIFYHDGNIIFPPALLSLKYLELNVNSSCDLAKSCLELEELRYWGSDSIEIPSSVKKLEFEAPDYPKTNKSLREANLLLSVGDYDSFSTSLDLTDSPFLQSLNILDSDDRIREIKGIDGCERLLRVKKKNSPVIFPGVTALSMVDKDPTFRPPENKMALVNHLRSAPVSFLAPAESKTADINYFGLASFSLLPSDSPKIPKDDSQKASVDTHVFKALLMRGNKSGISIRDYRIQIYDEISLTAGDEKLQKKLLFKTSPLSVKDSAFQPITQTLAQRHPPSNPKIDSGVLAGTLVLGQDYPLPLTGPVAQHRFFKIYQPEGSYEIGWYYDAKRQHYFVRLLAAPEKVVRVTFSYDFLADPNYRSGLAVALAASKSVQLPPELSQVLAETLQQDPALAFLFESEQSLAQKLQQLQIFCLSFADEPLRAEVEEGTLAAFLAIIQERRGACSQRAQVFMILARWLGVDVQIVENGFHSYCEGRSQDGACLPIELGGGVPAPESVNRNPQAFQQLLSGQPPEYKEIKALARAYEAEIRLRRQHRPPFDWTFFDHTLQPVLINLPAAISMATVRRDYFSKLSESYLYIDNPGDFDHYGDSYCEVEKMRVLKPGLLHTILKEGGILLINWSNFSQDDRLTYESLWSEIPRLGATAIEGPVKIVGFLLENLPSYNLDVCRQCTLPRVEAKTKTETTTLPKEKLSGSVEPMHTDVHQDPTICDELIETLRYCGDKVEVQEGPLLKAIRTKRPWHIHQLPEAVPFHQTLEQVDIEKRVFVPSIADFKPADVTILLFPDPAPQTQKAIQSAQPWLQIIPHDSKVIGTKIYLNCNNWYTLFTESLVDLQTKLPWDNPGKLEQYRTGEKPIFYITETLSASDWEQLQVAIGNQAPDSPYIFQLAPGVSGPGITVNAELKLQAPTKPLKQQITLDRCSQAYVSDDPDYLVEQVLTMTTDSKAKRPRVIDLTPQSSSCELLVQSTDLDKKNSSDDFQKGQNTPLRYEVTKGPLFKRLEAGKTVILKGEVPALLMQELLPLFSDDPHLVFNGERIPISGRLILIQPKANIISTVIAHEWRRFSWDHYRASLLSLRDSLTTKEEKKEKEAISEREEALLDKLSLFYHATQSLEHRGAAMPKNSGMTWHRLVSMWRILLAKEPTDVSHKHNSLKSLMPLDYDKDSEHYAFLNVLGKFLFDDSTEEPAIRTEKYQALMTEGCGVSVAEYKKIDWQLLNICNGSQLRALLGENWLQEVLKKQEKGTISSVKECWSDRAAWFVVALSLDKAVAKMEKDSQPAEKKYPDSREAKNLAPPLKIDERTELGKMQRRLKYRIEQSFIKVIVIKGPPGTGKTHYLNELITNPAYSCHNGLSAIGSWLADKKGDKPKLLLLDEINTREPGMLAFLEGLKRTPPSVFYEGKFHTLTLQHKIVATGNPEHYSGRHYHDLLRLGASTIWATLPKPAYLKQWLHTTYGISLQLAEQVLSGADLFKQCRPLIAYSFRDLENLMQRYTVLRKADGTAHESDILYKALDGEFGMRLFKINERQAFKKELAQRLKLDPDRAVQLTTQRAVNLSHRLFPKEMADAHEALNQALLIRQYVRTLAQDVKEKDPSKQQTCAAQMAFKRGIVLEGATGIGKNLLCRQILKNKGLSPATLDMKKIDPEQHYSVVSATESEATFKRIADQAFRQGMILVIKHFHRLKPEYEQYLGSLLMGVHPNSPMEKAHPGFFVLGMKTSSSKQKEEALSPALCNRMQMLQIPEFSQDSWQQLAEHSLKNTTKAKAFVQSIFSPKRPYPQPSTARHFFQDLKQSAKIKPLTPSPSDYKHLSSVMAKFATQAKPSQSPPLHLSQSSAFSAYRKHPRDLMFEAKDKKEKKQKIEDSETIDRFFSPPSSNRKHARDTEGNVNKEKKHRKENQAPIDLPIKGVELSADSAFLDLADKPKGIYISRRF